MYSIDLQIEQKFGQQQKKYRYDKHNTARRKKRLIIKKLCCINSPTLAQQDLQTFLKNDNFSICDAHQSSYNDQDECSSIESILIHLNEDNVYELINKDEDYNDGQQITSTEANGYDNDDEQVIASEFDDDDDGCIASLKVPLHKYTVCSTLNYCGEFIKAARQANLSKLSTNNFLSLIKSALPVPNNSPVNEEELLTLLDVVNLFSKRTICLLCGNEFHNTKKFCPLCCSTDKRSVAFVYESDVELIITQIVKRLSLDIDKYKYNINNNDDHEQTNDIPFGSIYQNLLKKNHHQDLISLLLHVDGIGITSSTKLKMWMLSGSIIELPPKLRCQRFNMVVISIWIAYVQPPSNLWLNHCVNNLQRIKTKDIHVSNKYYKLIIFGITGDCPALSLITNFINHNGYFSCWFCFIEGQYMQRKMQFHYESIHVRSADAYTKLSNKAEKTNLNVYGHRGQSILIKILDVELPHAIVLDYLHISLLGHGKLIISSIYDRLKPKQREHLNIQINNQYFPHFFNRKLRSFDNFAFIKATEIRNLLFYGLLPHLDSILHIEQYSHLTLYICALRLLHSGHIFGNETSTIAHQLFIEFYKDHELFYSYLQNFKLHLHIHLSSLYETHGSLCNLGCFGQESLIGFVSENHHVTQYYGDSIVHFYNIDLAIQNKTKKELIVDGPYDLLIAPASSYVYLEKFHPLICACDDLDSCCKTYRRFILKNKMFHSSMYNKRGNSVSYFIQYTFSENDKENRFGVIDMFFVCNGTSYAVIKHHRTKHLFSDAFKKSSYYFLLKKPVDQLYFIVECFHSQFDIIPVYQILNHCIVVDRNNHLFVTNILSYNEHD